MCSNARPIEQRNPIYYTSLTNLGIDPDALEFSPGTPVVASPPLTIAAKGALSANTRTGPLTIAAAKAGLALYYGVRAEAVEIVIRG
jgi:hypothetical protein